MLKINDLTASHRPVESAFGINLIQYFSGAARKTSFDQAACQVADSFTGRRLTN